MNQLSLSKSSIIPVISTTFCSECKEEFQGLDQIWICDECEGIWCTVCWCDKDIEGDGEQEGLCCKCEMELVDV